MPDFAQRSYQKELLDREALPTEDLHRNLRELEIINHWLGGNQATLKGLDYLMQKHPRKKHWVLADIGCGGGDMLRQVARHLQRKGHSFTLYGLDLKPDALDYARRHCQGLPGVRFLEADYRSGDFPEAIDIFYSCLFCHHLNEAEMAEHVGICQQQAQVGWVINDLHRHPFAYYNIRWLTGAFSRSYLVRNDAPLSVLRGWRRPELAQHLKGLPYRLSWEWAFRWVAAVEKNRQ